MFLFARARRRRRRVVGVVVASRSRARSASGHVIGSVLLVVFAEFIRLNSLNRANESKFNSPTRRRVAFRERCVFSCAIF